MSVSGRAASCRRDRTIPVARSNHRRRRRSKTMGPGPVRVCRTCHLERPLDCFGIDRSNADGIHLSCKECCRVIGKRTRLKHHAKVLARTKAWRARNTERIAATSLAWRASHREQRASTSLRWQRTHKATVAAGSRSYYQRHREHIIAYVKHWKQRNVVNDNERKAKYQSRQKSWRQEDPSRMAVPNANRRARKQ